MKEDGHRMVAIRYLGQNGFMIKKNGITICFDLYLSNIVFEMTGTGIRNYEPPCMINELNEIDYYFISHNHLDHLDPETIKGVANQFKNTKFVCPFPHINELKKLGVQENRIIGITVNKKMQLDEMSVYAIPQKHEQYEIIDGEHGTVGYVIEWKDFKVYHAGDGLADEQLVKDLKMYAPYDIMFLPINGHDWKRNTNDILGNMNYREALDLCTEVGTDLIVPMHYDLFANNTENPAYFVDYLYANYPTQKFKMFMPGEKVWYERG